MRSLMPHQNLFVGTVSPINIIVSQGRDLFPGGVALKTILAVPIIDAAISVQVPNGTDIYDPAVRGVEMGVFITNPETEQGPYHGGGTNSTLVKEYVGIVWPGYSYFPDWWAENTQIWWTEAFKNMSMFINFDG